VADMCSFLGLCSYYRRFIKGFSEIAAPLHELSRKGVRYSWDERRQLAFDLLKQRLTTSPVLGKPRNEGTYYLDRDASAVGLGAVLSQDQDGEERVLSYSSRLCSQAERRYCTTRKELLAVVFGLRQCHVLPRDLGF
jgi:hypothetical protein